MVVVQVVIVTVHLHDIVEVHHLVVDDSLADEVEVDEDEDDGKKSSKFLTKFSDLFIISM
jgi:hypothetical protein